MTQVVDIGPVSFRLSGVVYAAVPAIEGGPAVCANGEEMAIAHDGERSFLVVDHRRDASELARVEFWSADAAVEGGLEGLFVLAAARNAPRPACEAETLAAIAALFPSNEPGYSPREDLAAS